jgi:hypothetical protein
LWQLTFYGGFLDKLIKYTLIAFVSFNVLGGTYLGLREYSDDKEAKKSFTEFYSTDTAVLGAYDKKSNDSNVYLVGAGTIFIFSVGAGVTYSLIKREQLKNKE